MALLFLDPRFRALDSTGTVLPGAKLYFYTVGTTTLKTVWTDAAAGTPAANPFILDSNGEGQVWGVGEYKVVCKSTDDVEQWTIENYLFTTSGSVDLPTGSKALADNCIVRGDSTTGVQGPSTGTGWTIDDSNDMDGDGNEIRNYSETVQAVTSTTNAVAIDYSLGAVITHTLTESTTVAVPTNLPSSGQAASWTLEITAATAGSYTVAYNAAYDWGSAGAPTMTVTGDLVDVMTFYTRDGGTIIRSFTASQAGA